MTRTKEAAEGCKARYNYESDVRDKHLHLAFEEIEERLSALEREAGELARLRKTLESFLK